MNVSVTLNPGTSLFFQRTTNYTKRAPKTIPQNTHHSQIPQTSALFRPTNGPKINPTPIHDHLILLCHNHQFFFQRTSNYTKRAPKTIPQNTHHSQNPQQVCITSDQPTAQKLNPTSIHDHLIFVSQSPIFLPTNIKLHETCPKNHPAKHPPLPNPTKVNIIPKTNQQPKKKSNTNP